MRHAVAGFKLGRNTEHRRATFRNLAAALFQHGQITTTLPKARAVVPFVEKLITLAKKGDLASRRQAIARLRDREMVFVVKGGKGDDVVDEKSLIQKLFDEIGPSFADRAGGYTRIVKLGRHRIGDGADLVVLQLVGEDDGSAPKVRGRYSRRRQKQDNRTAFAARLRKARGSGGDGPVAAPEAEATEAAPEAVDTAEGPSGGGEAETRTEGSTGETAES